MSGFPLKPDHHTLLTLYLFYLIQQCKVLRCSVICRFGSAVERRNANIRGFQGHCSLSAWKFSFFLLLFSVWLVVMYLLLITWDICGIFSFFFSFHVLPQQPWLLTMSSLDFQSNVFQGKQRSPALQWKGLMSPAVICGCCQCCCPVMLVSCSSSRWRCWPNICPTFSFFPPPSPRNTAQSTVNWKFSS